MAKSRKRAVNPTVEIEFKGGPRDGTKMRVSESSVPSQIRLALPEWANYYRVNSSLLFEYKDCEWEPLLYSW